MNALKKLMSLKKIVVGMIHVSALPGTPEYGGNVKEIISTAVKEADIYKKAGIDAIAIENMYDIPYLKRNTGPEISTLMSIIGYEIKSKTNLPCGIQILAGANRDALAAANSAGLDFIRAEGFVFAHIADEGFIESDAGALLRYRKNISAENVLIFTDIKKKHSSHSITGDVVIAETAKAAEFFLSDGVIVTGSSTGAEVNPDELKEVGAVVKIPVIIGSGITFSNIQKYYELADAFIIGSYFKKDGQWRNGVDGRRVKSFMRRFNKFSG
ncbi:MAG: BtpA/SgcQ family protein [Bacteroidota bacterium]